MHDELSLNMDNFLPLRDVVFNTLRGAILNGQLKPGERLMEVHLAAKLGVSRTPIREAIRKLELEGLVVMMPRKGAEVAKISEKSLKDVLEVRRALDVLIAELACERITDEQLKRLKEAAKVFEDETLATSETVKAASNTNSSKDNKNSNDSKDIDATKLANADISFHDILIEATGNSRLKSLVNNLAEQMYRYRFVYLMDNSIHNNLIEEHMNIYNAILKRDAKEASEMVKIHIDNQEKAILRHIKSEQDNS
ncbi:MAG: GntR family transcriptional regulator [Lachnospiraceae bacterium]|nr:GntR family transcriptional regulator [Lachnospiraceae bacterium]